MNYQQHFTERVSKYLEQLKGELDEDLPRLGELMPEVTLGQADAFASGVADIVNTYNGLFHPAAKRATNGKPRGNWYQRKKELQGYDAKIEAALPSIFEKEGYVTAALVQQYAGIEESEATKRLKSLSKKYNWRTRQDPQKSDVIRYTPPRSQRQATETQPPIPAKGEQG
ncbi:MAG: hypothetical protein HW389_749 [Bacteroidetes bacterium]|nr:hypothetical protein [Bacteroidota bacterium]